MTPEMTKPLIEIISVVAMIVLPGLVIVHRIWTAKSGFTARTFQLCTILGLLPLFLVMGLTETLDKATLGTLLGSLMGYALGSGDKQSRTDSSDPDRPQDSN